MLPFPQKVAFLVFALVTGGFGMRAFARLYWRLAAGRKDTDARMNDLPKRIRYALTTTLLQNRTFRKRPWVSLFHAFIFYGFAFYLLVNLVDAVDGFVPLSLKSAGSRREHLCLTRRHPQRARPARCCCPRHSALSAAKSARFYFQRTNAPAPRAQSALRHTRFDRRFNLHSLPCKQPRRRGWGQDRARRTS